MDKTELFTTDFPLYTGQEDVISGPRQPATKIAIDETS